MKLIALFLLSLSLNSFAQMSAQDIKNLFENGRVMETSSHKKMFQAAKAANSSRKDSSLLVYWNPTGNTWQNFAQNVSFNYVYNANGDVLSYEKKNWISNRWQVNSKFYFVFDADHNLTSNVCRTWTGTKWENYYRYSYTYDNNNNKTSYTFETGTASTWTNSAKEVYVYANDVLNSVNSYSWSGMAWDNVSSTAYGYDLNKNLTNETSQVWKLGAWVNLKTTTQTYNSANEKMTSASQNWNGTTWINSSMFTYTYTPNHSMYTVQTWDPLALVWLNTQLADVTYDATHKIISENYQIWKLGTWNKNVQNNYTWGGVTGNIITNSVYKVWGSNSWITTNKYDQYYDATGFLKTEVRKNWNASGTFVVAGDSITHYSNGSTVGINNVANTVTAISIYPNPVVSTLHINTEMNYTNVKIINAIGENVTVLDGKVEQISVSHLTDGIYFIQLSDKKGSILKTEKFIKN